MIKKYLVLYVFMLTVMNHTLFAQSTGSHSLKVKLREVSLLDIEPTGSFELSIMPPRESGDDFEGNVNASKWINYTSSKEEFSNSKSISVELGGNMPEGIQLKLIVSQDSGWGQGDIGNSHGELIVTEISKEIISNIGGCYTGQGIGKGHNLQYQLIVDDYTNISKIDGEDILITYTITQ